jgi:hypothetical protein
MKIFNVFEVLAAIAVISAAILITGWLRDRRQVKKEKR